MAPRTADDLAPNLRPDTSMSSSSTPSITTLRVIPVAGRDSMLLNLSGAHGPFFTRNLLVLTDSAGRTGVGEVPGGRGEQRRDAQRQEHAARGGVAAGQRLGPDPERQVKSGITERGQ